MIQKQQSSEPKSTLRRQAMVSAENALQRIREHPFIRDAEADTLTKAQAERWIYCAGRESRSFPGILENMVARSQNASIREILASNLADEHGNGNPEDAHFKHYLHLLDSLGISRDKFRRYTEGPGIKLALSLAYNVSLQNSEPLALGYMLVNEGMTPITYRAAYQGLGRHHPALSARFFDLHTLVDAQHVADLYDAVDHLTQTPAEQVDLLFGIQVGERGMAVLLDEAYGLFDTCHTVPAFPLHD